MLLACCGAALATTVDDRAAGRSSAPADASRVPPPGIRFFDLHDPGLVDSWPGFLATTPMLNDELLPPPLRERLTNTVATYRSLTPVGRPAFFVATYFDLLSERLLAAEAGADASILPLKVCPVFTSGSDASVSSLLAVASGLPDALFVHAPGEPGRYRYLFLQTEISHCRFLAAMRTSRATPLQQAGHAGPAAVSLPFRAAARRYTAVLHNKEELRALLETVGEIDAIATFRRQMPKRPRDEADVLGFIRLLSLLATDGRSGYAAIPVLYPMLTESAHAATPEALHIADALAMAYELRTAFRRIVPFAIHDTEALLRAKLNVMEALAGGGRVADDRTATLLEQFVTGADLLLVTSVAHEKMPLIGD